MPPKLSVKEKARRKKVKTLADTARRAENARVVAAAAAAEVSSHNSNV
jgi:hypothetical protein